MIVDLSHPLTEQTPVYPGDDAPSIKPAGRLGIDGFNDHVIMLNNHLGTHIDAPAHMIDGGKNLNEYPIERFILPAVCIDASHGFSAGVINSIDIQPGQAVLFYTGAGDYFADEKYWSVYKVLDEACCQVLIGKKAGLVGVDAGSVDTEEGFPIHKTLLGSDILIIENLTNLQELIGKRFELSALPLKLEIDGAPARVIAKI